MFEGIGVEWGMTLLGCVAALFIPMPFILHKYGKKIRAKSKFAPAPDVQQDKRRDEEARGQQEEQIQEQSPTEAEKGESSGSASGSDPEKKDL
jgi:MFS transporter, DHA1 family, multidrug resistance protein